MVGDSKIFFCPISMFQHSSGTGYAVDLLGARLLQRLGALPRCGACGQHVIHQQNCLGPVRQASRKSTGQVGAPLPSRQAPLAFGFPHLGDGFFSEDVYKRQGQMRNAFSKV